MANGEDQDDDHQVGYGKPPKQHRWKKGQSGNPSGKRRCEERIEETFRRIAEEEILVNHNGSQTAMPQREAVIRSVLAKGMKGDVPAFKAITPFLDRGDSSGVASANLTAELADLDVLQTHADWVGLVERAQKELQGSTDTPVSEEEQDDHPNDNS
ncbi:hypothetical protein SAMN04490248_11535 [Salinihabitans flavidus]|uniref:DUF5681 domain-containing protein n=1 Tax=Salinihabitans flavidus TaxID=569882 RepID=A0A1H8TE09_9RHOB|nr:DUF5681 domain-containing protein [Salinihabitans flavidus]SEO89065.1 hypothetical protein SAMN04490248_11535 [Salinihabitans flavidus]